MRHLPSLGMVEAHEHMAEGASSRLPRYYLSFLSYVVALGTMQDLSMGEEALPLFIYRFLVRFKLLLFLFVIL